MYYSTNTFSNNTFYNRKRERTPNTSTIVSTLTSTSTALECDSARLHTYTKDNNVGVDVLELGHTTSTITASGELVGDKNTISDAKTSFTSFRRRRGKNDVNDNQNNIHNHYSNASEIMVAGVGTSSNSQQCSNNAYSTASFSSSSSSSSPTTTTDASTIKLAIIVMFWYILGVISISTTKIILRDYSQIITPLRITLQQLLIGSLFLQLWTVLEQRQQTRSTSNYKKKKIKDYGDKQKHAHQHHQQQHQRTQSSWNKSTFYLISTSISFTLGFLFTNYSFSAADASFVETIKASEPITSATLAYLYNIETLGVQEVFSLIAICVGVLISTIGNHHHDHDTTSIITSTVTTTPKATMANNIKQSLLSSGIVMCSNLCFSFRGLYQKLYRSSLKQQSSQSSSAASLAIHNKSIIPLSDNQLQLKVHQIGTIALLLLHVFAMLNLDLLPNHLPSMLLGTRSHRNNNTDDEKVPLTTTYFILTIVNAFAFTHYNLASSYVLTRVSVVHHAALNCIRRLFAIVMTSIIFGVPITFTAWRGILVSLGGFVCFTYYKLERKKKYQSLKKKPSGAKHESSSLIVTLPV